MSIATSTPLPTLLFAAFATIAVAGCGIHIDLDDASSRVETETVPATGLTRLDVTTRNGAIDVRPGTHDEIEIRATLVEQHDGDATYSIETVGDRLVLTGECDSRPWDDCRVGFVVTAPPDIDVTASTDNGKVTVDGIGGDVTIDTDNGAIDGRALTSGSVDAHSDNGRIRLEFERPPTTVETRTGNGSITVRLPDEGRHYDVDASSDNGGIDVDVRTDSDAEHRIVAQSGNGSIDVEYTATS